MADAEAESAWDPHDFGVYPPLVNPNVWVLFLIYISLMLATVQQMLVVVTRGNSRRSFHFVFLCISVAWIPFRIFIFYASQLDVATWPEVIWLLPTSIQFGGFALWVLFFTALTNSQAPGVTTTVKLGLPVSPVAPRMLTKRAKSRAALTFIAINDDEMRAKPGRAAASGAILEDSDSDTETESQGSLRLCICYACGCRRMKPSEFVYAWGTIVLLLLNAVEIGITLLQAGSSTTFQDGVNVAQHVFNAIVHLLLALPLARLSVLMCGASKAAQLSHLPQSPQVLASLGIALSVIFLCRVGYNIAVAIGGTRLTLPPFPPLKFEHTAFFIAFEALPLLLALSVTCVPSANISLCRRGCKCFGMRLVCKTNRQRLREHRHHHTRAHRAISGGADPARTRRQRSKHILNRQDKTLIGSRSPKQDPRLVDGSTGLQALSSTDPVTGFGRVGRAGSRDGVDRGTGYQPPPRTKLSSFGDEHDVLSSGVMVATTESVGLGRGIRTVKSSRRIAHHGAPAHRRAGTGTGHTGRAHTDRVDAAPRSANPLISLLHLGENDGRSMAAQRSNSHHRLVGGHGIHQQYASRGGISGSRRGGSSSSNHGILVDSGMLLTEEDVALGAATVGSSSGGDSHGRATTGGRASALNADGASGIYATDSSDGIGGGGESVGRSESPLGASPRNDQHSSSSFRPAPLGHTMGGSTIGGIDVVDDGGSVVVSLLQGGGTGGTPIFTEQDDSAVTSSGILEPMMLTDDRRPIPIPAAANDAVDADAGAYGAGAGGHRSGMSMASRSLALPGRRPIHDSADDGIHGLLVAVSPASDSGCRDATGVIVATRRDTRDSQWGIETSSPGRARGGGSPIGVDERGAVRKARRNDHHSPRRSRGWMTKTNTPPHPSGSCSAGRCLCCWPCWLCCGEWSDDVSLACNRWQPCRCFCCGSTLDWPVMALPNAFVASLCATVSLTAACLVCGSGFIRCVHRGLCRCCRVSDSSYSGGGSDVSNGYCCCCDGYSDGVYGEVSHQARDFHSRAMKPQDLQQSLLSTGSYDGRATSIGSADAIKTLFTPLSDAGRGGGGRGDAGGGGADGGSHALTQHMGGSPRGRANHGLGAGSVGLPMAAGAMALYRSTPGTSQAAPGQSFGRMESSGSIGERYHGLATASPRDQHSSMTGLSPGRGGGEGSPGRAFERRDPRTSDSRHDSASSPSSPFRQHQQQRRYARGSDAIARRVSDAESLHHKSPAQAAMAAVALANKRGIARRTSRKRSESGGRWSAREGPGRGNRGRDIGRSSNSGVMMMPAVTAGGRAVATRTSGGRREWFVESDGPVPRRAWSCMCCGGCGCTCSWALPAEPLAVCVREWLGCLLCTVCAEYGGFKRLYMGRVQQQRGGQAGGGGGGGLGSETGASSIITGSALNGAGSAGRACCGGGDCTRPVTTANWSIQDDVDFIVTAEPTGLPMTSSSPDAQSQPKQHSSPVVNRAAAPQTIPHRPHADALESDGRFDDPSTSLARVRVASVGRADTGGAVRSRTGSARSGQMLAIDVLLSDGKAAVGTETGHDQVTLRTNRSADDGRDTTGRLPTRRVGSIALSASPSPPHHRETTPHGPALDPARALQQSNPAKRAVDRDEADVSGVVEWPAGAPLLLVPPGIGGSAGSTEHALIGDRRVAAGSGAVSGSPSRSPEVDERRHVSHDDTTMDGSTSFEQQRYHHQQQHDHRRESAAEAEYHHNDDGIRMTSSSSLAAAAAPPASPAHDFQHHDVVDMDMDMDDDGSGDGGAYAAFFVSGSAGRARGSDADSLSAFSDYAPPQSADQTGEYGVGVGTVGVTGSVGRQSGGGRGGGEWGSVSVGYGGGESDAASLGASDAAASREQRSSRGTAMGGEDGGGLTAGGVEGFEFGGLGQSASGRQ